jgi:hypothetical protein
VRLSSWCVPPVFASCRRFGPLVDVAFLLPLRDISFDLDPAIMIGSRQAVQNSPQLACSRRSAVAKLLCAIRGAMSEAVWMLTTSADSYVLFQYAKVLPSEDTAAELNFHARAWACARARAGKRTQTSRSERADAMPACCARGHLHVRAGLPRVTECCPRRRPGPHPPPHADAPAAYARRAGTIACDPFHSCTRALAHPR